MARSEGNPLYVEEIVRKLIDDGVLRATSAAGWEVAKPTPDNSSALDPSAGCGAARRPAR